jgi:hypothetical protein
MFLIRWIVRCLLSISFIREIILYESNEMDLFKQKVGSEINLRLVIEEIKLLRVEISQKMDVLKSEMESLKKDDCTKSNYYNMMSPPQDSMERSDSTQKLKNIINESSVEQNESDEQMTSSNPAHDTDSFQNQQENIPSRLHPDQDEIMSKMNPNRLDSKHYYDLRKQDSVEASSKSIEDDQQENFPRVSKQAKESQLDVAMSDISGKCMLGICAEKTVDLYVQDSQFHLYTNYFKPTFPVLPTCKRAFIFTSMPYTGTKIQMIIVRKLMEHFQSNFRSYVFWNWHAHTKINHNDARDWSERMSEFLQTTSATDEFIIFAPYKDDRVTKELCETPVVLHEIRPLEDIALLRYHRYRHPSPLEMDEDDTLLQISVAGAVNYIRSMLLHQRYWEKEADIILSHRKFIEDNGLGFARLICLDYITEQRSDLCTDEFLSTILSSNEVEEMFIAIDRQNRYLSDMYKQIETQNDVHDNSTQIMNQIQTFFSPWLQSKLEAGLL